MTIAVVKPGSPVVIRPGENTAETARQRGLAEAAATSAQGYAATAQAAATSALNASLGPTIDLFERGTGYGVETVADAVDFARHSAEFDFANDYYRDRTTYGASYADLSLLTAVQSAVTWAPNADGTLTKFAANTPRVTDLGLRIGTGTTNLITSPDALDTWTLNNSATVTTGQLAPDGTNTAFRINDANAAGLANILKAVTVNTTAAAHTFSIYVKKEPATAKVAILRVQFTGGTLRQYDIQFSPDTGTAPAVAGAAVTVEAVKDTGGNDWWRVSLTKTPPETHTGISIQIYPASAAAADTASITVWMPQLEVASAASTPAVGTRAADQVTMALFAGSADDSVSVTTREGAVASIVRDELASSSAVVLAPSGGDIAVNGTITTIRAVSAAAEMGRSETQLKTLSAAGGQPATMASGSPTITAGAANGAATLTGTFVSWNAAGKIGLLSGDWVQAGAVFPDTLGGRPRSVHYTADGTSFTAVDGFFEFIHAGDAFEVQLKPFNSAGYRLWVDGELSANAMPTLAADGLYFVKVDFGSTATRLIRIENLSSTLQLQGIQVKTGQSISAPPAYPARLVIYGDSFTNATGATNQATGYAAMLAHELGFADYRVSGAGGTGWDRDNTSTPASIDYRDRWAYDMIAAAPDMAVVVGSINDGLSDPATVASRMLASVQELRAARPGCIIHIFGPQDVNAPAAPSSLIVAIDAAMQAALEGAGLTGAWYHSLIGVAFTKIGDGVHPDQAGHVTLKNYIYGEIAAVHGLRAL